NLAPQIALDRVVTIDSLANLQHFLVGQLRDAPRLGNTHLGYDLMRLGRADAMDILQRDNDAFVSRYINTGNSGHSLSLLFANGRPARPLCVGSQRTATR